MTALKRRYNFTSDAGDSIGHTNVFFLRRSLFAMLRAGADKISINSSAIANPELIRQGAEKFGSQCIVVSIDAKKISSDKWRVFSHGGRKDTGGKPPIVDPVAMRVLVHGFRFSALACAGRGGAPTGARQRAANTAGARYSSDECGLASL